MPHGKSITKSRREPYASRHALFPTTARADTGKGALARTALRLRQICRRRLAHVTAAGLRGALVAYRDISGRYSLFLNQDVSARDT